MRRSIWRPARIMPIRNYLDGQAAFEPEAIREMSAAFDRCDHRAEHSGPGPARARRLSRCGSSISRAAARDRRKGRDAAQSRAVRGAAGVGAGITPRKKVIPAAKSALIIHAPCSPRGAIMRRLDGGAGRRRDRRTGPRIRQPAPGNSGPRAGAAPALPARNRHPGGVGAPPGGTTVPCQELADRRRKSARESAARSRKENAAAERREARRPASLAGDLRRSGDGSARETGHRVRRFRTSACRRSAPLIFSGAETDEGAPAPSRTGRRSFAV